MSHCGFIVRHYHHHLRWTVRDIRAPGPFKRAKMRAKWLLLLFVLKLFLLLASQG